jgi:hypothetical protein
MNDFQTQTEGGLCITSHEILIHDTFPIPARSVGEYKIHLKIMNPDSEINTKYTPLNIMSLSLRSPLYSFKSLLLSWESRLFPALLHQENRQKTIGHYFSSNVFN